MAAARASFDFIVAGAGVAAITTAHYLARAVPAASIALVSPHAPMSQTSSLSTECFRNHWPSGAMRGLMSRSIELLEAHAAESSAFRLERAGYLFASRETDGARELASNAEECHGTDVRRYSTPDAVAAAGLAPFGRTAKRMTGADLYTTGSAALAAFPYLSSGTTAALHARHAGWMVSAHAMGSDLLERLRARRGADGSPLTTVLSGSVVGAELTGGRVGAVLMRAGGEGSEGAAASAAPPLRLSCGAFVNATGPFLNDTHRAVLRAAAGGGAVTPLPTATEVHAKVIFRDVLRLLPRFAPQVILVDPVAPEWLPEELDHVREAHGAAVADRAAAVMPGGAHFRPYGGEGSDACLLLWESWHHPIVPAEPPPASAAGYLDHDLYPDVAMRGLSRVVPAFAAYYDEARREALLAKRGGGAAGDAPQLRPPVVVSRLSVAPSASSSPAIFPRPRPLRTAQDGGYYVKTAENHPLVGPTPTPDARGGSIGGAFTCGALSGFGMMASHAAGELCAAHVTGASSLPSYAALMSPMRYQDEAFTRVGGVRDQLIAAGGGQL